MMTMMPLNPHPRHDLHEAASEPDDDADEKRLSGNEQGTYDTTIA